MSRIGRKPVQLPPKVKFSVSGRKLHAEGPIGKVDALIPEGVVVQVQDGAVSVVEPVLTRGNRGFQGLVRAMVQNMVNGVATGFTKTLEISGVGYKAELNGSRLVLTLGYSHPVEFTLPAGITAKIEKLTTITVAGVDRQVVGQVAAKIRAAKPPEPYQGKGVKYSTEVVRRKVGKTGAK